MLLGFLMTNFSGTFSDAILRKLTNSTCNESYDWILTNKQPIRKRTVFYVKICSLEPLNPKNWQDGDKKVRKDYGCNDT